ncbi:hypothetical protein Fleli_0647 [Bernardetia litoralis DSM 6794]|uniref:Uncharacterized protein n=1 Tax=Bernardetia litoralis (strain ATCC 23117 / DSM 6794 / NBRC 15988 / NCIMB 1366 / Fx l1 / Sio-4) TaxID=880071 RepID=I4AGM6_BERLS|nr:hypothetical protein [Bernardetia litoralis]AFM03111.1 hypothetical protein Fleli_0647 [Bernardetia litoralis DSM 6794]
MKKNFKGTFNLFSFIIIFILLFFNYSLYYNPTFIENENGIYNEELYYQLQFLKEELHNKQAGKKMQSVFPEGFMFINSLYVLSWINFLEEIKPNSKLYKEGTKEINWTTKQIYSKEAKSIFDNSLPLEYGAFYSAWSNYTLGKKILLEHKKGISSDSNQINLFKEKCNQISLATQNSVSPYLETYRNQTWAADMVVCIASLNLYKEIFENKQTIDIKNKIAEYDKITKKWIKKVKTRLDSITGLIPHSCEESQGFTDETARGSSQSLTLNFLPKIDSVFAKSQYKIYKELFVEEHFGLNGIREYPKNTEGDGDIDSGLIVLGIGGASSIVGQRAAAQNNDWLLYHELRNCIETFGATYTYKRKKKYIFGQLVMVDAFAVWSNSVEHSDSYDKMNKNWRKKVHIFSILIIVVLFFLNYPKLISHFRD